MQRVELILGDEVVPFYYGYDCFDEIKRLLKGLEADRFIIVTDQNVAALYGDALAAALHEVTPCLMLCAPAGEASKDLKVLSDHAERAIEWGATRRSVVIALGGGVPGNLGGLLAALLFRGIRFVHIPTTMIGMMDSVISLKQTVNSRYGKNLFGTFYRPTMVLSDLLTLTTLPPREVRAGVCEAIKNALCIHPRQVDRLRELLNPDCLYDAESYRFLLESSLAAKLEIMALDKHEKSRGLVLEYGHTIGHAIELADCTRDDIERISHGEAVGVGMVGAAQIAYEIEVLDAASVDLHYELLYRAGALRPLPSGVSPEQVINLIRFDNKRGYRKKDSTCIDMILLRRLGQPLGSPELPLTAVPISLIESVVGSVDEFVTRWQLSAMEVR